MFLRKITQQVTYPRPPQEAFEDVRQALLRIGKVKTADEAGGTLKASVRGGGWITLQVTISPAESGSVLSLVAGCDDVWGAGARRGIDAFLGALPGTNAAVAGTQADTPGAGTPRSLEDGMTIVQKISVAIFLAFVSFGSLDVAWGSAVFGLSPEWLYGLAAAGGALTGAILGKRRYGAIGAISGVVTGLCAVAFSVLLFRQVTYLYKIVAFFTTVLGCLPGLVLFFGLRVLQDRLFKSAKGLHADRSTDEESETT